MHREDERHFTNLMKKGQIEDKIAEAKHSSNMEVDCDANWWVIGLSAKKCERRLSCERRFSHVENPERPASSGELPI